MDLLLENEDFKLIETEDGVFDIAMYDYDLLYNLIRRAVETPLTYIGRYIIDSYGLRGINYDFGDGVYEDLAEGLTLTLVSRIRAHVTKAITQIVADVNPSLIEISLPDMNTVDIVIKVDNLDKVIRTRIEV